MKKKVLLIGELSEIVRSLNECLADDFQVQLCSEQIENVRGMVKITKPDLIIICQVGIEELDNAIFEFIKQNCPKTPALGITTSEDGKLCSDYYGTEQFHVMYRPVAKSELVKKCNQILGLENVTEPERISVQKSQSKKKIMIVDDSAIMLRSMKSMLDPHYAVCLAKSGEQALQIIPREKPDLILLDYEMEGMDGKAAFEAMKENEDMQNIPVVFLTSVADRQSIYSILKTIPDGYILKPPDKERIMATIREILGDN